MEDKYPLSKYPYMCAECGRPLDKDSYFKGHYAYSGFVCDKLNPRHYVDYDASHVPVPRIAATIKRFYAI